MRMTTVGSGPRLVLVHGSVANGPTTWSPQLPLGERFTLAVVERPGFPPLPPVDRVDFDEDAGGLAPLLEAGDHLVGHSYGGVIALLAAARQASLLRSLTVIEPPCFGVARGVPAVDGLVDELRALWADGPSEPAAFLAQFSPLVIGRPAPPRLSPEIEQGVRTLMVERGPWEADPPLDALRAAPFPKLVVSGAHSPAFDAVCDVLEQRLGAERAVLRGGRHSVQRARGFNDVLADFVERCEQGVS